MKRVKVGFWGIDSILEFVKITGSSRHKMELVCGSTVVDAKSLLSVLSVKAAQAVELVIHEECCERLLERAGQGAPFKRLRNEQPPQDRAESMSAGRGVIIIKTDRKRNLKN